MKTRKQWQEEFRKVGELAVSTDDCSDVECVVRYAANCIIDEIEKAWADGYNTCVEDTLTKKEFMEYKRMIVKLK